MATAEVLTSDSQKNIYMGNGWIRTANGKFDIENPEFDIWDIGYALGMNCRYNGHTKGFYSVAEHSVKVMQTMDILGIGNPLEGLLHDATEAYLTDIPAPFKQYLPDWKKLDKTIDTALREHFKLGEPTGECKRADWYLLFIEAQDLIQGNGGDFQDPNGYREMALALAKAYPTLRPECWEPADATRRFMNAAMHHGLCGNVRV